MARHDLYRNGNDKERKEERLSNIGTVQGTNGTICGGAAQKARKGTTSLVCYAGSRNFLGFSVLNFLKLLTIQLNMLLASKK